MELPNGDYEVIIESMKIEKERGESWLVSRCTVTKGEHVGKRLTIREPISGVCGKVEFDSE